METIQGLGRLQATIKELLKVTSPNSVAARVGAIIHKAATDSIEKERSAAGGSAWAPRWKPLNKKYAKWKKKKYGGRRILERGGKLKDLYNEKTGKGERVVGTKAHSAEGFPYPVVHQFGSKDGLIPARPFLPINKDRSIAYSVQKEIEEDLESILKDILEGK